MARLPEKGWGAARLLEQLELLKRNDWRWKAGRSFSLVYFAGDEHQELLEKAYTAFMSENALSTRAFPSLAEMQGDVLEIVGELLSAPGAGGGSLTSGGTESAFLALKAYRDSAAKTAPEVVLPRSAHPAYLKAAHYLGVRAILTECSRDYRADPEAIRAKLGPSTIAVIASAPSFPHGVIDPIEEIAAVAGRRGIGLHIDASLGGMALPWVRKLGYPVPRYDLGVPGVTSISTDLHKYGFAAKGAGVIFFCSTELRRHQFFATDQWSGGLFASPGLLGTRSGGSVAAAWAALHSLGASGYLRLFEGIMRTTRMIQEAISLLPELKVIGEPAMSVFAIGSRDSARSQVFPVAAELERRGWNIDRLNNPDAIHFIITPAHESIASQLISNLKESMELVRRAPEPAGERESVELYGMTSKFSGAGSPLERALRSLEERRP